MSEKASTQVGDSAVFMCSSVAGSYSEGPKDRPTTCSTNFWTDESPSSCGQIVESDFDHIGMLHSRCSSFDRRIETSGNPRGPDFYPSRRISNPSTSDYRDLPGFLRVHWWRPDLSMTILYSSPLGLFWDKKPFCKVVNLGMCVEQIFREIMAVTPSASGLYNTDSRSINRREVIIVLCSTKFLQGTKAPLSCHQSIQSIL